MQPYGLEPPRLLCPWGFSRQEYWSGLPCHSPGDLPNPGIEPPSLMSPALAGSFFTTSAIWEGPATYTHNTIFQLEPGSHTPSPTFTYFVLQKHAGKY